MADDTTTDDALTDDATTDDGATEDDATTDSGGEATAGDFDAVAAELGLDPAEVERTMRDLEGEPGEGDPVAALRREAAAHRVKAREAEAQRDALAGRLEGLQRAEAERVSGEHLADPSDLWREVAVADLLSEDGELDSKRVREAAAGVARAHPHWGPPRAPASGGAREGAPSGPSFADELRRAAGG